MSQTLDEQLRTICDHLVERTASVFLGSGINAGIRAVDGDELCPLGNQLSEMICSELLNSPGTKVPLDEASEMARFALGDRAFNEYLFQKFEKFSPGVAHLALVQLPWDKIYTTNFDLLVEKAAASGLVKPFGTIPVVTSLTSDVSVLSEEDMPYYKLHGSLDTANTRDGRIVLTKKDYREYEKFKKPLFKRLKVDLESRTFVFIGYSLSDPNFRGVLDDCSEELGAQSFPRSFAVIHDFTDVQKEYWKDRYNIELIRADSAEFLIGLKDVWTSEGWTVVPMLERKSGELFRAGSSSTFQMVGDSFYVLRTTDCTGQSDAARYFKGAEPTWADIRDDIPAKRDLYDSLLEVMFPEFVDVDSDPGAYVITGSAGTGKTSLLYQIAYNLTSDFQAATLIHIPGTPLDCRLIQPLVDANDPRRFVVVIRHASENVREIAAFFREAVTRKLPVTLLLEDRTNQWHVAKTIFDSRFNPDEFELGRLSESEVDRILDTLKKHDCLDRLTGLPRDEQVSHFNNLAGEDLLVALRELTAQNNFDQIVRDEYNKIPSEIAKKAYVSVASIGQLGLALRYETLIRILGLKYGQLADELFGPTEGILFSSEDTGSSRHNRGFRLRARHPIIASIIFGIAAEDDASKFRIFNEIMTELDAGFPEDMRLLRDMLQRREFVNTLASHDMRRALFERLEILLPGDPYVWQHRSIIEREMQNAEAAVKYARMAKNADVTNRSFVNTLGFALEFAARDVEDTLKQTALLSEASKIFEDALENDPSDPYSYLGLFNVIKQKIARESGAAKRELQATALSLLTEAWEETGESEKIAGELANLRNQLGSLQEGIDIVKPALAKKPTDVRLRDLLVRFLYEKPDYGEALNVAREGSRLDPTSWRLQRWLARLRQQEPGTINIAVIKGNYEAALRHHKGDVGLMVEYASFLFKQLELEDAKTQFQLVKSLTIAAQEKRRVRSQWKEPDGNLKIFTGKIQPFKGPRGAVLSIPQNFEASFWRGSLGSRVIREGETVRFTVNFTGNGPEARILNVNVSDRLLVN